MMDNLIETLKKEYSSKSPKPLNSQFRWGYFGWVGMFLCLFLVCLSGCAWYGFASPYIRPTKGDMIYPRIIHNSILLKNGKGLIWGGDLPGDDSTITYKPVLRAEIYDPNSDQFNSTGKMFYAHKNGTATVLQDGTVLFLGGSDCRNRNCYLPASTNEIYDPKTGKFKLINPMLIPRLRHQAVLLPDGRVLIIGGERYKACESKGIKGSEIICPSLYTDPSDREQAYLKSMEIYDPKTGLFHYYGHLQKNISPYESALLLNNQEILMTGGLEVFNFVTQKSRFISLKALPDGYQHFPLPYDRKILLFRYSCNYKENCKREFSLFDPIAEKFTKKLEIHYKQGAAEQIFISPHGEVFEIQSFPGGILALSQSNHIYSYNLKKNQFKDIGDITDRPIDNYNVLALRDGGVLITGGTSPVSFSINKRHFAWLYKPTTRSAN